MRYILCGHKTIPSFFPFHVFQISNEQRRNNDSGGRDRGRASIDRLADGFQDFRRLILFPLSIHSSGSKRNESVLKVLEAKLLADSRERDAFGRCVEPTSGNDSALLEAFDDAKRGGRRRGQTESAREEERDSPGRCSLALVGHFRRYWYVHRAHAPRARYSTYFPATCR